MKKTTLALLLLLASLAHGEEPRKASFPDEYQAHPCAANAGCRPMGQHEVTEFAALRGFDVGREWVEKYWYELLAAMQPYCAKAATCYAVPGNHWTFCNDVIARDVQSICDRFEKGSKDELTCRMVVKVGFGAHDLNGPKLSSEIRNCAGAPAINPRKLDVWMTPEVFDVDYSGRFTVYALDADTHVPVQGRIEIEGQKLTIFDVPDGRPTTWYEFGWRPAFIEVPAPGGKRAFAVPKATITAPGYRTVTLPLALPEPKLIVEMKPKSLRPGDNEVTITARDAATGTPVEMRVMAGGRVAGKANEPFTLKIERGRKRPEIWITSLFNRYADVVVLPAEK